jgi:hypothetical protein
MTEMLHPVVVVGCRRSGTTLLRAKLGGHPDLLVHPGEPQFILGWWSRFGSTIRDVPTALSYVTAQQNLPEELNWDDLRSACTSQVMPLRQLVLCYLQAWAGDELKRKRVVLKHPALVFHLDLVFELFPEVHIVHVVRDPRASVSSQRSRWPQLSVWEAASWWRDAARAGRDWARQGKTPYTEIQFEHLVNAPDETLRHLCRELGVPYATGLLDFDLRTMSFEPGASPRAVHYRTVDASRLDLWRERLEPTEVRLVETCCRSEMQWWGYAPVEPQVSPLRFAARHTREILYYKVLSTGRRLKATTRRLSWRLSAKQLA